MRVERWAPIVPNAATPQQPTQQSSKLKIQSSKYHDIRFSATLLVVPRVASWRTTRVPALRAGRQLVALHSGQNRRGTPPDDKQHRSQVGNNIHHTCNIRRSVLRLLPSVLQHQFRRRLLAVDAHSLTFQWFLVINGIVGPLLLGGAVATFFNGSNFIVEKQNLTDGMQPVISSWANASHGLDALLDPWNLILGLAVFFLARVLGSLYFMNNIKDDVLESRCSVKVIGDAVPFLILFVAFLVRTLMKDGYAVDAATGAIVIEPMKYLHNIFDMWYLLIILLIGVSLVLYGIIRTVRSQTYIKGIWPAGIGTVLTVLVLFLLAGWNNTAYYPSNIDLQSSLSIQNSSSSEFTLRTMFYVSLLIPFVLAYIAYVWRSLDRKQITKKEIAEEEAY